MRYSQTLFSSARTSIGQFDCPKEAQHFRNTGPVGGYLMAFPRTAVKIRHSQMKRPFVANATITTLYNHGQEYERFALSDYGDRCDWLAICPQVIAESNQELHVSTLSDTPLIPVPFTQCPTEAYQKFRQLIRYLQTCPQPDALFVEETALGVFLAIMDSAQSAWGLAQRKALGRNHTRQQQWVDDTKALLSTAYFENLTLDDIANQVHCTPYHLCRLFKRFTGTSIHQSMQQLRLRHALDILEDGGRDLTTLSAHLGFSDHSHFSQRFRQHFGLTPSQYRDQYRDQFPDQNKHLR